MATLESIAVDDFDRIGNDRLYDYDREDGYNQVDRFEQVDGFERVDDYHPVDGYDRDQETATIQPIATVE